MTPLKLRLSSYLSHIFIRNNIYYIKAADDLGES
jgi:hypothetical protein